MGRLLPLIAAAVLLAPALARAEHVDLPREDPDRPANIAFLTEGDADGDIPFCLFLPYSGCSGTFDIGIGYGGGRSWGTPLQWEEPRTYLQLYLDAGYLFRVSTSPVFQIGPTVGFELELFDETRRYHIFATVRGRLWGWEWVTLEMALGPVGSLDEKGEGVALGGLGELAFTVHGHIGAFVQTQVLVGRDGQETRVTGGFRGSFTTWAILLSAMLM